MNCRAPNAQRRKADCLIDLDQYTEQLWVFPVDGRSPRAIASAASLQGCAWLPDGHSLVYGSSTGSTLPYPRICNLRRVGSDGCGDTQVTFGDLSHVLPDVHASGRLVACRVRSGSEIWRIPVSGTPAENVGGAVRITRQTGEVQVPDVSPDGSEMVYLSDIGGHANLWVSRTDGTETRQLTFEHDPSVSIGVPNWSPAGGHIAFVRGQGVPAIWLVNRDGRGLRQIVGSGFGACWSPDGRWLYYCTPGATFPGAIMKVPVNGGAPTEVRAAGLAHGPVVGEGVLYYAARPDDAPGNMHWQVLRSSPEDGPAQVILRIEMARVPVSPTFVHGTLSRDGEWMALPLTDGVATNIWALPTSGGAMRQLTDFGRPTLIARRVSCAPDGQAIYAAVAEITADVVMYDGLL